MFAAFPIVPAMALPPPRLLERFRNGFMRVKRSVDDVTHRTILSGSHQRKLAEWQPRIDEILACPDNALLPRVPGAGTLDGRVQTMHNGIKVVKDCYLRWRGTVMFAATGGVHEPQEERVFGEVLKHVKPGGVMIELGAYWAFYSLWFARGVQQARCLMIEPELHNLDLGKQNFRLNGFDGEFLRAFIGSESSHHWRHGDTVCIDDVVAEREIETVDILHSDIQGFEDVMLEGAARTLSAGKVRFVFLSTHSPELHVSCREVLRKYNFDLIADADLDGSYSVDGILVGQLRGTDGPGPVPISQRPRT